MTPLPCRRIAIPLRALLASCAVTLGAAGAQVGTNYCTPAPNSTGATASISASGSASVTLNDLTLSSANLPLNAAAYFLCSRLHGFVANPGGSAGNLCLGGAIGRRVGGSIPNAGATGTVSVLADLTALPQPSGAVVVLAGETWNFQCWYRDLAASGGATSNFSDGLEVLFTGGGGGTPIPELVQVPAGSFLMGSSAPPTAPYFNSSAQQPVHGVNISYPFSIGRYEVTQAEYAALMGSNPSFFVGPSRPVESVTWFHAQAYCAALTAHQASVVPPGYEYRLPTEAEWEYACRAGTSGEFHFGAGLFCNQARFWYSQHSGSSCGLTSLSGTANVGSYAPNTFGLHDMHGNVWEWCLDSFGPYTSMTVTNPFVTGGVFRVFRGGSWDFDSQDCRSAFRNAFDPGIATISLGFRVVLAPILVP